MTKKLGWGDLTVTAFHEQSRARQQHYGDAGRDRPSASASTCRACTTRRSTRPGASAQLSGRINDIVRLASVGVDFQQISGTDTTAIFSQAGTQIRTDVGSGKPALHRCVRAARHLPGRVGRDAVERAVSRTSRTSTGSTALPAGRARFPTARRTVSIHACRCFGWRRRTSGCAPPPTRRSARPISTTSIGPSARPLSCSCRTRSSRRRD